MCGGWVGGGGWGLACMLVCVSDEEGSWLFVSTALDLDNEK